MTDTCPHCGHVLGADDVEVKLDELRTACVDAGLVVAFDSTVREFSPNQRSIRLMAAPSFALFIDEAASRASTPEPLGLLRAPAGFNCCCHLGGGLSFGARPASIAPTFAKQLFKRLHSWDFGVLETVLLKLFRVII